MSSIARSTAYDAAAQVAIMVVSLVVGVYLARTLGDEGRGHYIYATTFAGQLLFSLCSLGMETAASTMVGRDRAVLGRIHALVLLLCAAVAMILMPVAWALHEPIRQFVFPGLKLHALLAIALAMPFWIYQSAAYGMLVGIGAIRARALFDLFFNVAQNAAVVVLLVMMTRAEEARTVHLLTLAYYGLIMAGAFVLAGMLVARGARLRAPSMALCRDFVRFGSSVYAANLGSNLMQRVDQYFVERAAGGAGAFGVYTLASSLTQRTQVFPQALVRSTWARLAGSTRDEAALLTAACFRQILALGLALLIVGSAAAPLLPMIYGPDFAAIVLPFIVFLAGRLFINGSWMISNFFTAHEGRPVVAMIGTWAVLPVQALACWLGARHGGLTGAALGSTVGAFTLLALFATLFLRRQQAVGLGDLLRLRGDDFKPWMALLSRLRPTGSR